MTRYQDMLRKDIRKHMSISSHKTLPSLVEASRERDLELETQHRKRRKGQVHASTTTTKKTQVFGIRLGDGEACRLYGKCSRTYWGVCRGLILGCFRCCQEGNYSLDCSLRESPKGMFIMLLARPC